ncbi:MAG: hypothetical protein ACPGVB_04825 [Chitinophagales bacterium]
MNITSKQQHIAKAVFRIENEQVLSVIENFIYKINRSFANTNSIESANLLALAMQPTPEKIDIYELAKVQGYNGKRLQKKLNKIDHSVWADEDMETLNQMIG